MVDERSEMVFDGREQVAATLCRLADDAHDVCGAAGEFRAMAVPECQHDRGVISEELADRHVVSRANARLVAHMACDGFGPRHFDHAYRARQEIVEAGTIPTHREIVTIIGGRH